LNEICRSARLGPNGEGQQLYVDVEPVIPIHLNNDWNIISRTIAPITSQDQVVPGTGSQFGIGNVQQSFFLSPALPKDGVLWGAGPIVYLPASDRLLGPRDWGAGLTGVLVAQKGPWTTGLLAHQLWPLADTTANAVINQTYLQPFLAYTTKDAWTFTINSESTYQWLNGDWSVPLNLQVAKLMTIGGRPVSFFVGARYWAALIPHPTPAACRVSSSSLALCSTAMQVSITSSSPPSRTVSSEKLRPRRWSVTRLSLAL
jgi:hypothetical protein